VTPIFSCAFHPLFEFGVNLVFNHTTSLMDPTSSRISLNGPRPIQCESSERLEPSVKLMRSVQLDDTGSSKGLWVQHPTGESPRLQSVAPTESPYQRGGCYSPHVTDTLLTFSPSEVYQPCRWAFALPSCASEPRTTPSEEGLAHTSLRSKVSIRQSPGRTPKSPPNPLEVAHLPYSVPSEQPATQHAG
jgi:hypothetical protein